MVLSSVQRAGARCKDAKFHASLQRMPCGAAVDKERWSAMEQFDVCQLE